MVCAIKKTHVKNTEKILNNKILPKKYFNLDVLLW